MISGGEVIFGYSYIMWLSGLTCRQLELSLWCFPSLCHVFIHVSRILNSRRYFLIPSEPGVDMHKWSQFSYDPSSHLGLLRIPALPT